MVQRGLPVSVERGHEQVEKAVVVVVPYGHRARVRDSAEAARRCGVFEAPLAQVAEQPESPVVTDDHEVPVEVPERDIATAPAPAPAPARDPHLSGHLAERAIQVVAVGAGSGRCCEQ